MRTRRPFRLALPLALALSLLLGLPACSDAPKPKSDGLAQAPSTAPFVRGMTVSCPTWGPIWGSPHMADSLRELDGLGVDWVAIHPYGRVDRSGTLRFRPAAELEFLERAVEMTRAQGLEMFWKPHLAYWGSFDWRGSIEFGDDEAAWGRFFDGYEAFIVDQARFAERHGLPLLAIGVELEATTHRDQRWRRVIAAVRRVYSGRIVYAANWDRLDRVPFWDAVDVIGVQAYFPLAQVPTDGPLRPSVPDRAALAAGWQEPLAQLRRLHQAQGKPVLFAEIGYNRSTRAAAEPWAYETEASPEALELRARLLEVALEVLPEEPWLEGLFWWKWMPGTAAHLNDRGDGTFNMRAPEALAALERYWGRGSQPEGQETLRSAPGTSRTQRGTR